MLAIEHMVSNRTIAIYFKCLLQMCTKMVSNSIFQKCFGEGLSPSPAPDPSPFFSGFLLWPCSRFTDKISKRIKLLFILVILSMHNFESKIQKFLTSGRGVDIPSQAPLPRTPPHSNQCRIWDFVKVGIFPLAASFHKGEHADHVFLFFPMTKTIFCHVRIPPLNTPLSPTHEQLTQRGAFR